MVLNAAVQMLKEADELKEKVTKFKSGTSMLQDRSLWTTQQQLQKIYQKVLVLDLDYALDKKVEQDLWNVGFKQQIEALQAISKDKKNPLRSEGQAMLSWVLQAAAGFYLCLLHQICTTFQLDLPFRRRASLVGCVEGWGGGAGGRGVAPGAALYVTQHCLVHLGDLARYRHQLRVAHTFYRHAVLVCPQSGQPYNQLGLVSRARGRRLCAVYWHVRSLLTRAPFPPAHDNLARALAAHNHAHKDVEEAASGSRRLDPQAYVSEFLRALYYIHASEELETLDDLVQTLNSSLITLVATNSFESMTLIKMSCVLMWAVEGGGAWRAALQLAASHMLALSLSGLNDQTLLTPLKVWLQWLCEGSPRRVEAAGEAPALWAALADLLNQLADSADDNDTYRCSPLPEDEALVGFTPLCWAHKALRFRRAAATHSLADPLPPIEDNDDEGAGEVSGACLSDEPELQKRVRARRVLLLGKQLADMTPHCITYTEVDGKLKFTACVCVESELRSLRALAAARDFARQTSGEYDEDSDDEQTQLKPPVVISEADFREKVREKRAGILKPQGSLERAREERAMATQDEQQEEAVEESRSEERKEARRSRVNIAMAAIMRKQEEINKQVKFVSPPPTPDSTTDTADTKDDKPKMIQPKPIKSLANLPLGRKTGGILSLKDKSAGYPHLVNNDPEKKQESQEKKEMKPAPQPNYKRQEPAQAWTTPQTFTDPRVNFQKNYGIQNTGLSYNPNYQSSNQGIRLPVVNPKEIDVRTAALQKQNSRQDMFQEPMKFNHNYPVSGDKKNFLNDLPPRFANQYRYWQNAQENQYNDNKFRDDSFKSNNASPLFNQQPRGWMNPPQLPDSYQQPPWWKPDNQSPNFNYNAPNMVHQPNYFTPLNSNLANPYQNMPYNVPKTDISQPYLPSTIGQPMQTLQSLVSSPNFNSPLNTYNSYPSVPYDSAMYPQFNKLGYQGLMQKPPNFQGGKDLMDIGVGFGNTVDAQRSLNVDSGSTLEPNKGMEGMSGETAGNTYSLFSGAPAASSWGSPQNHPQQSLWSGPGPSPLERLLEQQKQLKPPSQ